MKSLFLITIIALFLNSCGGLKVNELKFTKKLEAYPEEIQIAKGISSPDRKAVFLVASGYYIYVEEIALPYNYQNVQKVLKSRGAPEAKEIKNKGLEDNIRAFEYSFMRVKNYSYLAKKDDESMYHISFASEYYENKEFEKNFANAVAEYGISKEMVYASRPRILHFLENEIELLPTCEWSAPLSMGCENNGQMNWAFHKDMEDAKYFLDLQKDQSSKSDIFSPDFETDTLNAKFLGQDISLEKIEYNITYPTNEIINSDKLTAYYLALEYEGEFLHAVLSYYDKDNTYLIDQFLEFE